jgi:hypothetical protein
MVLALNVIVMRLNSSRAGTGQSLGASSRRRVMTGGLPWIR